MSHVSCLKSSTVSQNVTITTLPQLGQGVQEEEHVGGDEVGISYSRLRDSAPDNGLFAMGFMSFSQSIAGDGLGKGYISFLLLLKLLILS